jgi:hypothetical protein
VSLDGSDKRDEDAGGVPNRPERASLASVDRRNRHPRDLEAIGESGLELPALRLVAIAREWKIERTPT